MRSAAVVLVIAVGCAPRGSAYRFGSPMIGGADVPTAPLPGQPAGGQPGAGQPGRGQLAGGQLSGRGTDARPSDDGTHPGLVRAASADAAALVSRGVVWSRLPARHRIPVDAPWPAVREPTDLRTLVGRRDARDPIAVALAWAGARADAADGAALLEWADRAGRLAAATDEARPGDLLVFDHAEGEARRISSPSRSGAIRAA